MPVSAYRHIQRMQFKWHKYLRLEQSGLPKTHIAKLVGVTPRTLSNIEADPYYQEFRDAKLKGRVAAFDRHFSEQTEKMIDQLKELIPLSIQVYEKAMTLGLHDQRYIQPAIKAADSINDRVGVLSRQSTQVHELRVPEADLERARAIAKQLKAKTEHLLPGGQPILEGEVVSEESASVPTEEESKQ